ncbi:hypothetical protein NB311A_07323 [Nitrobacter sp. Nb-311A]|uniref:hypothetical protein n=1 Tax=Nitrobacter sp. Nb-311A TaxID=314253 RepID=UPI0000684C1E|nr:hypothetical protein [Nitrobacter sp. Nb-311A]EAQ36941.1 hypothetical protein NB311A_07323 [Nitrobacter sp. Nb-311A]
MTIRVLALDSPERWTDLEALLGTGQGNPLITGNLVRHLRELGARSVLMDDDYIDRDFSEAFSAYYAKTFKRHSKVCKRILFFSCELDFLAADPVEEAAHRLEGVNAEFFLGFIVLRPISKSPISQAILRPPAAPTNYERHLLVRARYTVHILGAELSIESVPMTQQDSRVGACAQASIWVSARHIHARHRGPWLSTVNITDAAIARSESQVNSTLPAGSEFLTVNNTVAAFRAAGREPLIYAAGMDANGKTQWGNLRPQEIINRYVDSGIPVSVWVKFPQSSIAHSIVVTGQVLAPKAPATLPQRPTRAEYCSAFLMNDDQQGPNLRLPATSSCSIGDVQNNVQDSTIVLIIPLPSKVYLPAETAETLAWAILDNYVSDWSSHKTRNADTLGTSERLGDGVATAHAANKIVARTYLTYGWKYKHRAIRNDLNASVKQIVRDLDVPRYVYVTEFSLTSQLDDKELAARRVIAHVVVDATAKHHDFESILLFHAPGMCLWHSHGVNNTFDRFVIATPEDGEYFPKTRGDMDFAAFYASKRQ